MSDDVVDPGYYGINLVVYGHAKHGKSYFGDTSPAPRLVLDAEGGSRFTPSRKRLWDPSQPPPEPDGAWETAIVPVRSYRQVQLAFAWLDSGRHPFRSVVVDSLSDVQQRIVDDIAGVNQMSQQDWGKLLRVASDAVRRFRDLTTHPTRPLDAVVFIAMARQVNDVWQPLIQGQLGTILPYLVDLCVFLYVTPGEDGRPIRRLLTSPCPGYVTGERVGGALGAYIDEPSIAEMLRLIRTHIAGNGVVSPAIPATPSPVSWGDLTVTPVAGAVPQPASPHSDTNGATE